MVKLMIEMGADMNKADNGGWTPLYGAARNGHVDVVEVLVANGADRKKATKRGKTPLDLVRDEGIRRLLQCE